MIGVARLSVRLRVTVVATLVFAALLAVVSIGIVRIVENDVRDGVTDALRTSLQDQADALGRSDLGAEVARDTSFELVVDGSVYQLGLFDELSGGNASGNLSVDGEPLAVIEIDLTTSKIESITDPLTGVDQSDTEIAKRLSDLTFEMLDIDGPGGPALLVGATAVEEIATQTSAVRRALLIAGPIVVGLFALLTWGLIGRALSPVALIRRRVEEISSENLDERVPVPGGRDEVARLALMTNDMLDRLETGDRRQREFAADASHELRTPLATIRAAAESISLRSSDARVDSRAADILAETDRVDALIGDLLHLAQSGSASDAGRTVVDLADLAHDIVAGLRIERAVDVAVEVVPEGASGMVSVHRKLFERILSNLLSNALRHAHHHVVVVIDVGASADTVTIAVDDDGTGIDPSDRARVFERFTRLDEARSRDAGGVGLGLAIVRAAAAAHGGSVDVSDSPVLAGARLTVRLPATSAS